MGATATAIAITSCACCVILVPPLIIQARSRNWIITVLITSVLIRMFMAFLNALIWPEASPPFAWDGQILCDIEIKLLVAVRMSIPGSLTCIFRKLSNLLNSSHFGVEPSKSQRIRSLIFDITLCVGLPVLRMFTSYIVQPVRYSIRGIYGCNPVVDMSWPSYLLTLTWPVTIHAIGLVYGSFATWRMLKHYHEISEVLPAGINRKRLVRTYVHATILFALITPATVLLFYNNNILPFLEPYSWSRVHPKDWSQQILPLPTVGVFTVTEFTTTLLGYATFLCFGLGSEAREHYRKWLGCLRTIWHKHRVKNSTATSKFAHTVPNNTADQTSQSTAHSHELDTI